VDSAESNVLEFGFVREVDEILKNGLAGAITFLPENDDRARMLAAESVEFDRYQRGEPLWNFLGPYRDLEPSERDGDGCHLLPLQVGDETLDCVCPRSDGFSVVYWDFFTCKHIYPFGFEVVAGELSPIVLDGLLKPLCSDNRIGPGRFEYTRSNKFGE
jgi:hypothetical protein